jgi:NitT/TauT family transport system ATP-binding protein
MTTPANAAEPGSEAGGTPAISVRDLLKVYGTRAGPVKALEDVAFAVRAEEFVAVVGPSGCGKTTVLKILAGLVPPTSGAVEVFGAPVRGPVAGVGMVFQAPVLLRWRTVLDNVLLPIEILHRDRRAHVERAQHLLALAGIAEFAGRYPRELSGGMQQRVAICRALVHDPRLLLMDEPFGALDALTRDQMNLELLRIWSESRKTSVLITHSIPEAVFLADRVIVMTPRPGRVAEVVAINLPRPRAAATRLDPRFTALVERIGRLLGIDYTGD